MQMIFVFFLIEWINCWNVITQKRIVESMGNDNLILDDNYLILAKESFQITYKGIIGYRRLHMIFDAQGNFSQMEILIKVNGIRRSLLVLEEDFKEFHIEFEHQASDIKIQFILSEQFQLSIRNFNLFVDECPKNCKYCLSGYCDLEIQYLES